MSNAFGLVIPTDTSIADIATQAVKESGESVAGGKPILKMDKLGDWTLGKDGPEMDPETEFLVPVTSIAMGFIAWKNGRPMDKELSYPFKGEPRIIKSNLNQDLGMHTEGDNAGEPVKWDDVVAFDVYAIDGPDTGDTGVFETGTYGGKAAFHDFMKVVAAQARAEDGNEPNEMAIHAVIKLNKDSYKHKKWGKLYNPIFEIVDWLTFDEIANENLMTEGEVETEADEEPAPKPKPKPKKKAAPKRKAKAKAEEVEEVEEDDDVIEAEIVEEDDDDTPPPASRRRRRRS